MFNSTIRGFALAGMAMAGMIAAAQGPGDPMGGDNTNLSKKPGGSLAIGMTKDNLVKALGPGNIDAPTAGFSITTVTDQAIASEVVWSYKMTVPTPYAYNPRRGTWLADPNLTRELQVYRHIGFNKSGIAIADVVRVNADPVAGVELLSAIKGMTPNGGLLGGMKIQVDGQDATYSSLQGAVGHAQFITTPSAQAKAFGASVSNVKKPGRALVTGSNGGHPTFVLADSWEVNPVGALSAHVPDGISPLVWTGATAPAPTPGKGGAITVQSGTVPGVDVIIKCMSGHNPPCKPSGPGRAACPSWAVVTQVRVVAVGAIDSRKLMALQK